MKSWDKVRKAFQDAIAADMAFSDRYAKFRQRCTGPVGQGFAIELLPPLEDDMPRTKIPNSRTAMEQAIPPAKPNSKRDVEAQDARADKSVELPDPLPCPYCKATYTDLQTRQRMNTQGEYTAAAFVTCLRCFASGPIIPAKPRAGDLSHVRKALEEWNRVAAGSF